MSYPYDSYGASSSAPYHPHLNHDHDDNPPLPRRPPPPPQPPTNPPYQDYTRTSADYYSTPSPPLPPNPYLDRTSSARAPYSPPPPPLGAQAPHSPFYPAYSTGPSPSQPSSAPPLPAQPQYPSYLSSRGGSLSRDPRDSTRRPSIATAYTDDDTTFSRGHNTTAGTRESVASGIISMYASSPSTQQPDHATRQGFAPRSSPVASTSTLQRDHSYTSSRNSQPSTASSSSSVRPVYPSAPALSAPSPAAAPASYSSYNSAPAATASYQLPPLWSDGSSSEGAWEPSSSTSPWPTSQQPVTRETRNFPNDQVAPSALHPERKQSLEYLPGPVRNTPSRQPTILTTPPIGTTPHYASQHSSPNTTPSSTNYSFFSNSTVRRPSATLSPNTSLTATSALHRADSASSFGDGARPEYLDPALLSNIAAYVKEHVPRGTKTKGAVDHPQSFTGEEIVTTILRALPSDPRCDRKFALSVARSLHQSLWFHEVDWSDSLLADGSTKVYAFLQDEVSSSTDFDDLYEIPTSVITRLTPCISPFCGKEDLPGACYSYTCPNRANSSLQRQGSTLSAHSGAEVEDADNWASSVPATLLESLSKKEIQYQSIIFELIQGEVQYFNDLELIETGFVEPLRAAQPPIIPPDQLDDFLASVLLNIADVRHHSRVFLDALLARQKAAFLFTGIGQLNLAAAVERADAYTFYTINFPMADWLLKQEKLRNPRFHDLLMDFQKLPGAKRRGFDSFSNRATFRGLRYELLLEQIYKYASEDDPDREYIQEALSVTKQQAKDSDAGITATRSKVALREFHRDLVPKSGETLQDLELLDDSRRFFTASKVFRRPDGTAFTDWSESHLILFDHYLVTTKPPRERDGHLVYSITRRAVPLDLIQLKATSFSEPPVTRSSGFHLRSTKFSGSERLPAGAHPVASNTGQDAGSVVVYPISFFQIGRYDGPVHYYVDSAAIRQEWELQFKEALAGRAHQQEALRVVRLDPLADQTFGAASLVGSLVQDAPANSFGRPTCSVPLKTPDGQSLIVAGCSEGLFIGFRGRPRSMRQVVHLAGITQCAVLPEFGFVLVLANKVLIAYSLEALIPSGSKLEPASKAPQRLSGQKDVSFFRVGKVGKGDPRTLVIYAKKNGVKESVFKALEPVSAEDRVRQGSGHRLFNFSGTKPDWFRTYKEFFIPTMVTSLQFHRTTLGLVGSRGIEFLNLDDMKTMTVPSFPTARHDRRLAALAKRCDDSQTLGMFRLQENRFLLAYAEFALYVSRHGEPLAEPTIEWESKPEQVAYFAPYIFAFSPTIIEIRNAFDGRLVQFITGTHINLTYDGAAVPSGLDARSPRPDAGPDRDDSETHVHFSMRVGAYHVLYEVSLV